MENTYFDYDYAGSSSGSSVVTGDSTLVMVLAIAAAVVLVATLVLVIVTMVKVSKMYKKLNTVSVKVGNMDSSAKDKELGAVFCKKCGSQYKASESECPYCGAKK